MLESTVLGVPIDSQSYIKTIIATHYNSERSKRDFKLPWSKENLAYLDVLFAID